MTYLCARQSVEDDTTEDIPESLYAIVNAKSISMTLASFCVVKQSWHCFAHLIENFGLGELEKMIKLETYGTHTKKKLPKDYADECELRSEFD